MSQNTRMLIGAVIAAALAIAVYYGVLTQQQASNIETQTNQTLGTGPAGQQPAPQQPAPAPPQSAPAPPPPAGPTPPTSGPAPR